MKSKRRQRKLSRRVQKPGTGRPRLYDAVPSAEAMAKRQMLAAGGDPTKTTMPLDILEMRGVITASQSESGRVYGWLRRMIYGRTDIRAFDPAHVAGRDVQAETMDWDRMEERYRELSVALIDRGWNVRRATDDTCVYNLFPDCGPNLSARGRHELDLVCEGLDAMDRVRTR